MEKKSTTPPTVQEQTNTSTQVEKLAADKPTKSLLDKVQEDLNAANDKYLRLYSEFENFRRRASKEKLALIDTAEEAMLKKLLPIVDDFERALTALQSTDTTQKASQEGIRLIYEKLSRVLRQMGVHPMVVEKGTIFDVEFHEAVTQMPASDDAMRGKVLDVVEKGYLLREKVVRFAKVVIGE